MRRTSRLIALCLAGALSASMPCIAIAEEQAGMADAAATQVEAETESEQLTSKTALAEVAPDTASAAADKDTQKASESTSTDTEATKSDTSESVGSASEETADAESAKDDRSSGAVAENDTSASGSSSASTTDAETAESASTTTDPAEKDAAASVSDGIYTIESAIDSSKSIDIPGRSSASGASVQINADNQTPAQRFSFIKGDDGSYTIRNVSSQLVLDVQNAVAADGTRVQQYSANGTDAQKWELASNEDGSWTILSWLKGANGLRFALDIPNAQAYNGASLRIWERNGSKGQDWTLGDTRSVQDGTYEIQSAIGTHCAINVADNSESSGANINSRSQDGSMSQRFAVFYDSSSGYYTIKNAGTGRSLDISAGSIDAGANIQQSESTSATTQKWAFISKGNGTWEIVNAQSGLALDLADTSHADGANIQQWFRNGTMAQTWAPAPVNPLADGRYTIVPVSSRSFAVDAQWGSVADGTPVQVYSRNGSDAQSFEISSSSEAGYYVIRNVKSGKYLTLDAAGAVRDGSCITLSAPDGPEDYRLWKPVMTANGIAFISKTGLALDIDANGMWNGNKIQGWTLNGTDAQHFNLIGLAAGKLGITDNDSGPPA